MYRNVVHPMKSISIKFLPALQRGNSIEIILNKSRVGRSLAIDFLSLQLLADKWLTELIIVSTIRVIIGTMHALIIVTMHVQIYTVIFLLILP